MSKKDVSRKGNFLFVGGEIEGMQGADHTGDHKNRQLIYDSAHTELVPLGLKAVFVR